MLNPVERFRNQRQMTASASWPNHNTAVPKNKPILAMRSRAEKALSPPAFSIIIKSDVFIE